MTDEEKKRRKKNRQRKTAGFGGFLSEKTMRLLSNLFFLKEDLLDNLSMICNVQNRGIIQRGSYQPEVLRPWKLFLLSKN